MKKYFVLKSYYKDKLDNAYVVFQTDIKDDADKFAEIMNRNSGDGCSFFAAENTVKVEE